MFDISWGEIAVLGAVGVAVTGKRDLPKACRFVGYQLGRVVGLLQGARARADRFAHHNELKALQNELRSGLRELDQVKTEIAVAASTRGVMGRGLGSLTPSANRTASNPRLATGLGSSGSNYNNRSSSLSTPLQQVAQAATPPFQRSSTRSSKMKSNADESATTAQLSLSDFDFQITENSTEDLSNAAGSSSSSMDSEKSLSLQQQELSPAVQSERAVMEEEWIKQGIDFKAQAEKGTWETGNHDGGADFGIHRSDDDNNYGDSSVTDTTRASGSELLEHLERQCLIFDQYDRVVGEQEAEMERRVESIQNLRKKGSPSNDP